MPIRGFDTPAAAGLNRAGDALGAQAAGADAGGAVGAANVDLDRLKVGQPTTLGFIHGVANVVAGHRPFATDFTALRHLSRFLTTVVRRKSREVAGRRTARKSLSSLPRSRTNFKPSRPLARGGTNRLRAAFN
uniref:Uncharacterized protein n=1 Tax=mine drainage metagenome TaxID=410659 RepID=E6PJ55_9ZZZZ